MVNKAALAVLGIIVLVSMGIGVLIGMQLGDPTGSEANQSSDTSDGGPTPIPAEETTVASDGGQTPTAVPRNPDDDRTTRADAPRRTEIPSIRFDEAKIASRLKEAINQRRAEEGLDRLRTDGSTVDELDRLATDHSIEMATEGRVNTYAGNSTSRERYKEAGLYSTCALSSASDTYIIQADYPTDSSLEVIGRTFAGRIPPDESIDRFNENETMVARDLVDSWFNDPDYSERLTYENANSIGVGVVVPENNAAYATVTLC
jgi:uncharacterized protein YkwD